MRLLETSDELQALRTDLMQFFNEFGLAAEPILSMARRVEPTEYEPGEVIIEQGARDEYIYFLVSGNIEITIQRQERSEVLGERGPVTLLGEISYFNDTPATATVRVRNDAPAVIFRLSYRDFTEVLEEYEAVRPVLARIGDMRVITQHNGFASWHFFMNMIGWKHDRLAVNRALFPYLERAVNWVLLPQLKQGDRILDVGDGPGLVCEIIHESRPEWDEHLYVQSTHLEEAILNPVYPYPSDFSRARYLRERFNAIVALQVFNHVHPDHISEQFQIAARLLEEQGLLLVVRLRVVTVSYGASMTDTDLLFKDLERLVEETWPGVLEGEPLVKVGFMDADLDPLMEWNPTLCDKVNAGEIKLPSYMAGVEKPLLTVLMEQARMRVFDPDEVHFHWLVWQGSHHGFTLESSDNQPDVSFFYQLYRRTFSLPEI